MTDSQISSKDTLGLLSIFQDVTLLQYVTLAPVKQSETVALWQTPTLQLNQVNYAKD